MPRPRLAGRILAAGAVTALATVVGLCACDPQPSGTEAGETSVEGSARTWPAGVVVAVDDIGITAEQAQPWITAVGELYPSYSKTHRRRLALTNVLLPRAASVDHFELARREAEAACTEAFAALETLGPGAPEVEGTWRQLGLELWHTARHLTPGQWTPPTELLGRWVLVRLDGLEPGRAPQEEKLVLRLLEFPYVEPAASDREMRAAVDASKLTVVDPEWKDTIPEDWKLRMKGEG